MKSSNAISMLIKYYEGLIAKHRYNIEVYLQNAAGVGEHPDLAEAIDMELTKYCDAVDKVEKLQQIDLEF